MKKSHEKISESNEQIFDRLDTFSNVINVINTLSVLVFREYNTGAPQAAPRVYGIETYLNSKLLYKLDLFL